MDVFIIGITGGIGGLLAQRLRSRGEPSTGSTPIEEAVRANVRER